MDRGGKAPIYRNNQYNCNSNKNTIKVCVSCSQWCLGTSAPSAPHLMVSLYLCSSGSIASGEVSVLERRCVSSKKLCEDPRRGMGENGREKCFPQQGVINLLSEQINELEFFTCLAPIIFECLHPLDRNSFFIPISRMRERAVHHLATKKEVKARKFQAAAYFLMLSWRFSSLKWTWLKEYFSFRYINLQLISKY